MQIKTPIIQNSLLVFGLLISFACNITQYGKLVGIQEIISKNTDISTVTVISTSEPVVTECAPTPRPTQGCTSTIERISHMPGEYIFWWSESGNIVYYEYENGTIWAYDLQTREKKRVENTEAPPSEGLSQQLINHVPEDARRIYPSPSGKKVVYAIPIDPQMTPTPQTYGIPSSIPNFEYNLYLVEEEGENIQFIGKATGQLRTCIWTPDESKLFIDTQFYETEAYVWMVDLLSLQTKPFIPFTSDMKDIFIIDISPDGHNLLFGYNEFVWIKNIESEGEIKTSLRLGFLEHWWFYESNKLVFLKSQDEGKSNGSLLFVYDFNLGTLEPLTNLLIDPIKTVQGAIKISPNFLYLAYIEDESEDLLLISICPEMLYSKPQ
jgi:hypothetical protein